MQVKLTAFISFLHTKTKDDTPRPNRMSSNWISASFSSSSNFSSDAGTGRHPDEPQVPQPVPSSRVGPSLATLVSLTLALEQDLHDDGPFLFDLDSLPFNFSTRTQVASGGSFSVERVQLDQTWLESKDRDGKPLPLWHDPLLPPPRTQAELIRRTTRSRMPWKWWGKYVALKFVRRRGSSADGSGDGGREDAVYWTQLILELRTFLHSPIRYHPNVVRFLGLTWDPSLGMSTQTHFPAFILELSELGTLAQFQMNREGGLEMETKMLLGHDVAKGISILHACGIIHGDLKHENVLVFPHPGRRRGRRKDGEEIKFIAKVADFGGSVMDLESEDGGSDERSGTESRFRLHTSTPPYDAPETQDHNLLFSAEMMKKTDVYSLGLLVWRIMLDGKNPFDYLGALTDTLIYRLKESGEVLARARESVRKYLVDGNKLDLVDHVFDHTIQVDPLGRDLVQAVAALEVQSMLDIRPLLDETEEKDSQREEKRRNTAPGAHGIDWESIHLFQARFRKNSGTFDYQEDGPGARSRLPSPPSVDTFVFNAQKLKSVLPWSTQVALFQDLQRITSTDPTFPFISNPDSERSFARAILNIRLPPSTAAFYLFQSHMYELGTTLNPYHATHWLRKAAFASISSEGDLEPSEMHLAQAWCSRVHLALGRFLDSSHPIAIKWLTHSIIRGHRGCIRDIDSIATGLNAQAKDSLLKGRDKALKGLNTISAGFGAPWFMLGGSLKEEWMYHLDDLPRLCKSILFYDHPQRTPQSVVDDLYVNRWGHSLVHLAAAMGNLLALKALVEIFGASVGLRCRLNDDTPLLCASRGGHTDCVLYLLDKGADAEPDGSPYAPETPLYWLCAFRSIEDMLEVGRRLVYAGASLKSRRSTRIPKRNQRSEADYEDLFLLPVSPLSRAVMMQSKDAVAVLLGLGADPLEGYDARSSEQSSICPIVLASVLGYSEILKMLLGHLDQTEEGRNKLVFDEAEMLYLALDRLITIYDPTSLESRITRHGAAADAQTRETLRMLHDRRERLRALGNTDKEAYYRRITLALMVALERKEIVGMLLDLEYDPHGIPEACPIIEAVKLNHEPIYRLLIERGADPKTRVVSEGVEYDLLQILAENKMVHGRPGLYITEQLISSGVSVDCQQRQDGKARSAFVSAVINQDFELADCLLRHGAKVDFQFAFPGAARSKASVLGFLIHHPTERNLESVNYLLNVSDRMPAIAPPSFIVSEEEPYSVLHLAARARARTDMQKKTLGLMVRAVLTRPEYAYRVDYHIPNTSEFQPALLWAIIFLNLEVVEELIDSGADVNIEANIGSGVTPLVMAKWLGAMYPNVPEEMKKLLGENEVEKKRSLRRLEVIVGISQAVGAPSSDL
ncbi:hypothetical protein VKT23_016173 [Stygiomarasmius scandens]|uniref:Protein kinase domain-containing protein n=1 Tax=Marasmiellus scandens TaxID=2682957 RepID=A0ABR1IVD3_9AGAR